MTALLDMIINKFQRYSHESNFTVLAIILHSEFEIYIFKVTATSPRVQWVNRSTDLEVEEPVASLL